MLGKTNTTTNNKNQTDVLETFILGPLNFVRDTVWCSAMVTWDFADHCGHERGEMDQWMLSIQNSTRGARVNFVLFSDRRGILASFVYRAD